MNDADSLESPISARELFASIDWSRTLVGSVDCWSQRLRAMVEVVLVNRYPMIVLWGEDGIHVAYNDAYARLIGGRHPRAMGQRNRTVWPEVWHINGPILKAVLDSGREFSFEDALYPLERNGWPEEVYLTISYVPVRDDEDRIEGVLVTMVETTRNVLAERRLRSLRELSSRTARVRSIGEIGSIAATVFAENAGDIAFAAIFAAPEAGGAAPAGAELLGFAGLEEDDAADLGTIAFAISGAGGAATIELGTRANGQPYPGGTLERPVRYAYAAALPRETGGPRGMLVVGLSPAVPRDLRYREYLELMSAQLAVAFENATVFSREHRIADTLQRAALPGTLPQVAGLAIDAVYEAGSGEAQIGGDWYDAFVLRDGRVAISIGDVLGSGVGAAASMGAARQMIRGLAQMLHNPVEILNAVDRAFRIENGHSIITAFVGFLDADLRRLSYASAGHPTPFIRHADGTIEALDAHDLPIGLRDDAVGDPTVVRLAPGSVIILYTDGLTEATRDPIEGERRLLAALAREDFGAQPRKAAFLYAAALDVRPNDDVALLVIELLGPSASR